MLLRKGFLKFLIVAFVIYAVFVNKNKHVPISAKENPQYEFLKDVRSTVEVLTAEPKSSNLTKKNEPILSINYEDNTLSEQKKQDSSQKIDTKTVQNSASSNDLDPQSDNLPNHKTWLEQKILNVADNLLHTPQGQELLEKFLLNREKVPEHLNKSGTPKDPHHNNSIIEIVKGEGKPVECGDIVSAHYVIRLVNGQEVENTHFLEKPLTFQVGDQKVIKGLEYAVLGMQEGGKRRLVVPPRMAYNKKKFSKGVVASNEFVTIDVELLKIDPIYHKLENKVRIFDNSSNNLDISFMCSDPIFFNYTLTTLNNKVLSKSEKPVNFVLGSTSVPPAINKALTNLKLKSKRSIILPSNLIYDQKVSFLPADVHLPKNEIILLEIDTN